MEKRNPIIVLFLSLITCFVYPIVWFVKTKEELNAKNMEIPTIWLIMIPFLNFYWLWKYSQSVEKVTGSKAKTIIIFVLLLLGPIGIAIVQSYFNKVT